MPAVYTGRAALRERPGAISRAPTHLSARAKAVHALAISRCTFFSIDDLPAMPY
jgi:hypothetical protein